VTVLTQADTDADGHARFQTFVDVNGPNKPNEDQKREICKGIAQSLATHVGIQLSDISCVLSDKTTNKREVNSYVADLTVGSGSNLENAHPTSASSLTISAVVAGTCAAVLLN